MNVKTILKLLSMLLLVVAFFMILSAAVSVFYREPFIFPMAFFIPVGGIFAFFLFIFLITRDIQSPYLSPQSGFIFVALSWITASALGAIPYYLTGVVPSYTDAFFEAIAGLTTTGATVLSDLDSLPKSMVLWRSLTNWMGGMGIVVLTIAIFPFLRIGGMNLMEVETPGPGIKKVKPSVKGNAKTLWNIYIFFTSLEIVLLLFAGMDFFDALTTSLVSISTGGVGNRNGGISSYNSVYIELIVLVFMLLGGMNFPMHYKLIRGKFREVINDTEVRVYLLIFLLASLLITNDLFSNNIYSEVSDCLRYASFQVSSLLSTTGFYSIDYQKWSSFSQVILFLLLFVGGCASSTGGGIKIIRFIILFKMAVAEMKYLVHPQGVFGIFVNGQYLKKNIVYDCAAFVFLYVLFFGVVAFTVATGGYDLITSISASIACIGNTGIGFGFVGPNMNFGIFPDYIIWVLSGGMLIGRLEVYTILILLMSTFRSR